LNPSTTIQVYRPSEFFSLSPKYNNKVNNRHNTQSQIKEEIRKNNRLKCGLSASSLDFKSSLNDPLLLFVPNPSIKCRQDLLTKLKEDNVLWFNRIV